MRIFFIIIMFSSINLLFGQAYTPMLSDVNEWHLTYCFSGSCSKDIYYTDGDIEVLGNTYKVLDGYHYISREFLLREEIATKKVYLATIINNDFNEYLLYDFSLEVGEEFLMTNPVTPFPRDGGLFTLTAIEMNELADGNEYKHFYFSPSPNNTQSDWDAIWVEGVGSLSIPNAPGGNPRPTGVGQVSCSFRNGALFYADYTLADDCVPTQLSTTTVEKSANVIVISEPNSVKVQSSNSIQQIIIYDIHGRIIRTIIVDNQLQTTFATDSFNKGLYLLKVIGREVIVVKKIRVK